jgi:zinc/manganese transport system substrate-binding protein
VRKILSLAVVGLTIAGCGGGNDEAAGAGDPPSVVVTTTILGDIVRQIVGEQADVQVLMPVGADPHEFAVSSRQAEAMEDADLLVVNGAGFEQAIEEVIDAAIDAGAPHFALTDHVALFPAGLRGDELEEHADESADEHAEHGAFDPHVWTDPSRVATAVEALGAVLAALDGVDAAAVEQAAVDYVAELRALDAEIDGFLDSIPIERRVLVTNHEVFGYFAERYGFEVIGAVIPSVSTQVEASARQLEQLAEQIEAAGVPAIFVETSGASDLAEALAEQVGDGVELVELYTESLGEPGSNADTYIGLMRTDAERIAAALTAG